MVADFSDKITRKNQQVEALPSSARAESALSVDGSPASLDSAALAFAE
jgi:hypothetical protein